MPKSVVYSGNNYELLTTLESDSLDSCVTDPPYELGFMGKHWDRGGIANDVSFWSEVFRVLKPGAHLLAFGGTRTYHRMACAIEDAGFEIRDCLTWNYGSGFPKSLDVSKAIDREAGAEREVMKTIPDRWAGRGNVLERSNESPKESVNITSPTTPDAKKWNGWGTALKPSYEPIVLARKPIFERTVAANVLKYGTGAINVDGCRVEGEYKWRASDSQNTKSSFTSGSFGEKSNDLGRFPANSIFDRAAADVLDGQSGASQSVQSKRGLQTSGQHGGLAGNYANLKDGTDYERGHSDSGGASRFVKVIDFDPQYDAPFFYEAKASTGERNFGLNGREKKNGARQFNSGMEGQIRSNGTVIKEAIRQQNNHPTVKPVRLMQYLIKLVTPPGGTVLDPFLGSGTTGVAAKMLGFDFIGMEREKEYVEIAEARIAAVPETMFDSAEKLFEPKKLIHEQIQLL